MAETRFRSPLYLTVFVLVGAVAIALVLVRLLGPDESGYDFTGACFKSDNERLLTLPAGRSFLEAGDCKRACLETPRCTHWRFKEDPKNIGSLLQLPQICELREIPAGDEDTGALVPCRSKECIATGCIGAACPEKKPLTLSSCA